MGLPGRRWAGCRRHPWLESGSHGPRLTLLPPQSPAACRPANDPGSFRLTVGHCLLPRGGEPKQPLNEPSAQWSQYFVAAGGAPVLEVKGWLGQVCEPQAGREERPEGGAAGQHPGT